jgi:hypothetical protein
MGVGIYQDADARSRVNVLSYSNVWPNVARKPLPTGINYKWRRRRRIGWRNCNNDFATTETRMPSFGYRREEHDFERASLLGTEWEECVTDERRGERKKGTNPLHVLVARLAHNM